MTERSFTMADIRAQAGPDSINPKGQTVPFEWADPDGLTLTTKLRTQGSGVSCPMCGEHVFTLYASPRGLMCPACKKRRKGKR